MKTTLRVLFILLLTAPLSLCATLVSAATGNWTTNTTWKIGEAGAGAVMVTRSASTSSTSTTTVWSSAWTCTNLDVLEGVVLHLKRNGTTGTVTVSVSDDNGVTETRSSAATNLSSIPADATEFYFPFSSTLTCDGGADYKIGVKFSAASSGATVYRDGTGDNWFRIPLTSANPAGAPAAGDNIHVAGGYTATMNSTDSTDHGTLDIGNGTVTFGATASTNYVLKLSGDLNIWAGGTLNVGTVATPMPSTSSGKILLDCTSNVEFGLIARSGSTWVMQGATKVSWAYLAADAAANATSLTTNVSTGWLDNDEIVVASTSQTWTQTEKGTLNGAASGATLTIDGFGGTGGGVAYAHSGTAPTRAEIGNLTRNVQVSGASISLCSYVLVESGATVDIDYSEFFWLGSGSGDKYGFDLKTTSAGAFDMRHSSLHDGNQTAGSYGLIASGSTWGNATFTDNTVYNFYYATLYLYATTGTWTISDNLFIKNVGGINVQLYTSGGTFTGNHLISSNNSGIILSDSVSSSGTFSGNVSHSNAYFGLDVSQLAAGRSIGSFTIWRNASIGMNLVNLPGLTFSGFTLFGNSSSNITLPASVSSITFVGLTSNGDTTYATQNGINLLGAGTFFNWRFDNCDFSSVSGILTAHTYDLRTNGASLQMEITARNTKWNPVSTGEGASRVSVVHSQTHGQVAGDHRSYYFHGGGESSYGVIQTDSVIYKTAAPSARATPNSATVKLEVGTFHQQVNSGGTVTFSVWVRKSQVADPDGADYNGSQPRLIVKANPSVGIASDTVLDTMSVAVGTWELLTGTTAAVTATGVLQAVVDCDGTAGWINADEPSSLPAATAKSPTYWLNGSPAVYGGNVPATGGTKSFGWPQ